MFVKKLKELIDNNQISDAKKYCSEICEKYPDMKYYQFMLGYLNRSSANFPFEVRATEVFSDKATETTREWFSKDDFEKVFIVWVGRFSSKTGYGTATKDYFNALSRKLEHAHFGVDVRLLGVDSKTFNIIGGARGEVSASKEGEWVINYKFPENSHVHVICHETSNYFPKIQVSGKARLIGLTVHEFREQIENELELLTCVNELWLPSRWNKSLVCQLGFTDDFVNVVPHTLDLKALRTASSYGQQTRSPDDEYVFLFIISNIERKNSALVLQAYLEEFTAQDGVSLIVKLPANIKVKEIERKILPYGVSERLNAPQIVFIRDNLTDEEMLYLQERADCIINAETSKGFDLNSFTMLSLGKDVVTTYVGGVTEYVDRDNIYPIELDGVQQYFSDDNFSNSLIYASVVAPSPSIFAIRKALRRAFFKELHENPDVQRAVSHSLKRFDYDNISEKIISLLNSSSEPHDFSSLHAPMLRVDFNYSFTKLEYPFQKLKEGEIEKLNSELRSPKDFASIDDWVVDRRALWGKYGAIPPIAKERARIHGLKNKYRGKRCFVLGNGPSLNRTDLAKLKNEYTFCANKFYLKFPDIDWRPTFYTCLDWRVTPDDYENIQEVVNANPDITFFFPNRFSRLFKGANHVYWYYSLPSGRSLFEKFEIDATRGLRGGGTVATAMIQLAAFLGFSEIYLIGTDVTYKIPETVIQEGKDRFKTGVKINLTSTEDDDPNHFISSYFGKGARWHDPNVPEMKRGFRATYLAAKFYGVNVYNATVGGALDCIPRVDYGSLFK